MWAYCTNLQDFWLLKFYFFKFLLPFGPTNVWRWQEQSSFLLPLLMVQWIECYLQISHYLPMNLTWNSSKLQQNVGLLAVSRPDYFLFHVVFFFPRATCPLQPLPVKQQCVTDKKALIVSDVPTRHHHSNSPCVCQISITKTALVYMA